ncbi:MAG: 16S rRNA (adenine(1518)-N(6)/adenine(1519)-N(6))-dimethyltransferase RsmA [Clostridium sp.]|jgi:16S rRNA (adenine1518-N6/adenine1519-N6)-dimethyltransferase|nr:16S rRNA (adenine(1518)-N(6)/adenine(1519)-N(6))-dimethyltransferase RsmA [Clostridium sp.]MDY5896359.1 16S rRNA (adenine(1518)-N(6)/adenine(1519)-N(6))-dimethyltransferase RsmA [Oscillospiraceae bacterium]
MLELTDIGTIKALLARHGFHFSKALGQNFIVNPSVCPRMADESGIDSESGVIEIGAGIGVLTAELAKRAKKVVCIELDSKLLPILDETLADFDNIEIINADVLKTDLAALIEEKFGGMPVYVCANLPYYITSPVIMTLLESRLPLKAVTVMVQREAAQRLCAPVGSRLSGAVTVAVDYYAEARKLFDVSAGSFMPAPKVDSSVIRLDIREKPGIEVSDEKLFFSMVHAAFSQRRKTASNSISSGTGIPKAVVAEAIERCGFPPSVRAESMTAEQLAALCEALNELK